MPRTAKPGELKINDWFVDPRREGRRPAKVVGITGTFNGKVHFTLDDATRWGPWAASYGVDERLELA